ncbi:hypothetical protein MMA35_24650, partial [Salmonella enterica]|nr:hypothetical protein [Salmonella enterica]
MLNNRKGVLFREDYPRKNSGYALFEDNGKPNAERVARINVIDCLNFEIDEFDPVYEKLIQEAKTLIPDFLEGG